MVTDYELLINGDKIVTSISTSDFRSANQVTPCHKSRHSLWLLEFTQTPLKRKKLQMDLLYVTNPTKAVNLPASMM